jgi:hypothetical protein
VRLAGHGLSVDAPDGWEARIFKRPGGGSVLHLATFPLHGRDGDYGAAATGRMGPDDVFAAILEFRPDGNVRPRRGLSEFAANQLQVTRSGHYGWQRFYTDDGRPCCVYAVVAPVRVPIARLVTGLGDVLATVGYAES